MLCCTLLPIKEAKTINTANKNEKGLGMRNTTITYQGKEYCIGCNYRTKWQKSKNAHWMLIDFDEITGVCTLSPKQKTDKIVNYIIKTDASDLIYIDNKNNIQKRGKINRCVVFY